MLNSDRHQMEFVQIRPSGAEEWRCPTCGRRILRQWAPRQGQVILDPGDTRVPHSGRKNGQYDRREMTADPAGRERRREERAGDPILSPELRAALEELDFGDWPDARY